MNSDTENKDLNLARRAAMGDSDAQEQIYLKFKNKVYGTCIKILRNSDIAEDLVQMTFMQIFRKIHTFAGNAKLSTWIYRITTNEVLMHLRREKKHLHLESLTEKEDFFAPSYRMRLDDRILLENCIQALPDGYRSFFVLHDVIGFEHNECAEILGKSEGTSKSQLHKARAKMKKLIKKRINPTVLA